MSNSWLDEAAEKYVKSREDYDTYYENGFCQNNYTDMREAFKAGARAALEKAAEIAEGEIQMEIVEPGETKKAFSARFAQEIANRMRALLLNGGE